MRQLVVAVPGLEQNGTHAGTSPRTGISRVLHNLSLGWGDRVQLVNARFEAVGLPLLRGAPYGIRAQAGAGVILFPQLTGAEALRDTHGVPGVVIVHDIGIVDFPIDREGMDWLTYRAVLRSFQGLRYASRIIAVSEFTCQRLARRLPEVSDRIHLIPNAVASLFTEYRATRNEARSELAQHAAVALSHPLLLCVGSETPRKNMPLLMQVLRGVKDQHPGAQLIKVGNAGGAAWRKRTLAAARANRLEVGRDIVFLESVSDAILAAAYRAADVYVSTSLYEGFGLPAAEALACGTQVVVTDRASFPETVGASGRLAKPEAVAFSDAVLEAVADASRPSTVQRPGLASNFFRTAAAADRYLEVLTAASRLHQPLKERGA